MLACTFGGCREGVDLFQIEEPIEQFLDFEDCLQEECAVAETVNYIVTRNPADFKQSSVKVIEPDEFVKLL
jgi:hypothetical protein